MKLSKQQVEHIAKLARLGLSENEKKKFQEQLSSILAYFEKLKEVDTEKVAPTAHAVGAQNVMREDEAKPQDPGVREKILKEVPARVEDLVKVKKVL